MCFSSLTWEGIKQAYILQYSMHVPTTSSHNSDNAEIQYMGSAMNITT